MTVLAFFNSKQDGRKEHGPLIWKTKIPTDLQSDGFAAWIAACRFERPWIIIHLRKAMNRKDIRKLRSPLMRSAAR
jgi:hypothetical protein